jgi:hypothetical protein
MHDDHHGGRKARWQRGKQQVEDFHAACRAADQNELAGAPFSRASRGVFG